MEPQGAGAQYTLLVLGNWDHSILWGPVLEPSQGRREEEKDAEEVSHFSYFKSMHCFACKVFPSITNLDSLSTFFSE